MNGWIAQLGVGDFPHYFGGSGWCVNDTKEIAGGPTLLLDFDLRDPRFRSLSLTGLDRLPITSYINCDLWIEPQVFQIIPETSDVVLLQRSNRRTTIFEGSFRFPNPLPQQPISLRDMTTIESAVEGDDYWQACDTFLGGGSFIRVFGPPIWLQRTETPRCQCDREQEYVCSLGYSQPNDVTPNELGFFIGEAALYFFVCTNCKKLTVLSQPT